MHTQICAFKTAQRPDACCRTTQARLAVRYRRVGFTCSRPSIAIERVSGPR